MFKKILTFFHIFIVAPINDWFVCKTVEQNLEGTDFLVDPQPYSLPLAQHISETVKQRRFCVMCKHSVSDTKIEKGVERINYVICTKFPDSIYRSVVTSDFHGPTGQLMRSDEKLCGKEGRFFEPVDPSSVDTPFVMNSSKVGADKLN